MRNGRRVFDTDCHQMEPPNMWVEYIDPAFRDRAPRIQEIDGYRTLAVEDEPFENQHGKYPMNSKEFLDAAHKAMLRFDRALKAKFSPESRLADMDEEGVDAQVLYPTKGGQMLGREFRNPELLLACCRAYNDWSHDYCSKAPDRLFYAAMIPLQEPDLAIEEVRRAAAKGAVSFYMRPNPIKGRNIHDEAYHPLWREVERLGKPVCLHDSGSPYLPSYGDRMESHTAGHMLAHPLEAMSAMMGLIWWGIPELFPKLTIVHVEADCGWLPYWLQRMEQHWDFSGKAEHPLMRKSPSEYFKSNFYVAARGDERTLKSVVELVGDDNITFNTDYPHPDGTFPSGFEALDQQPIPEESKRKILWDNAARAFRVAPPAAAAA